LQRAGADRRGAGVGQAAGLTGTSPMSPEHPTLTMVNGCAKWL
jgi:hypothetical protein